MTEVTLHPAVPEQPDPTHDPLVGMEPDADELAPSGVLPQHEAGSPQAPPAVKSRVAAGFLGIFLGFLGAHRFYLGYPRFGAMQLLLFLLTFGIPLVYGLTMEWTLGATLRTAVSASAWVGLWGLIEGSMILGQMVHHDGQGRPLR